jgi:hypothetical protein
MRGRAGRLPGWTRIVLRLLLWSPHRPRRVQGGVSHLVGDRASLVLEVQRGSPVVESFDRDGEGKLPSRAEMGETQFQRGHTLVAPVDHQEHAVADFSVEEYLVLQASIHRVDRALQPVVPTERLYPELGEPASKPACALACRPLPPGVPYERQQLVAMSWQHGVLETTAESQRALAQAIRRELEDLAESGALGGSSEAARATSLGLVGQPADRQRSPLLVEPITKPARPMGKTLHAGLPTDQAFDWIDLTSGLADGDYFLVVFRSLRSSDADHRGLWREDGRAFAEALSSGGLIHYHQGRLDRKRRSVSFCLWRSQADAKRATALPLHRQAARLALNAYTSYVIERLTLQKRGSQLTFKLLGMAEAATTSRD